MTGGFSPKGNGDAESAVMSLCRWGSHTYEIAAMYEYDVTHPYNIDILDIEIYGANTGPTWDRHDPGGPHVGPTSLLIWDITIIA